MGRHRRVFAPSLGVLEGSIRQPHCFRVVAASLGLLRGPQQGAGWLEEVSLPTGGSQRGACRGRTWGRGRQIGELRLTSVHALLAPSGQAFGELVLGEALPG
eukprot:scaffold4514_cov62-Phaeocystis_antarctica.AAC.3